MKLSKLAGILAGAVVVMSSVSAQADQLDEVIKRGTLNCGVVLDFPPMGSRS